MLYTRVKLALILTSLCPIVIVFGINEVANSKSSIFGGAFSALLISIIIFLLSLGLCYFIIRGALKTGESSKLTIKSYDRRDEGLLSFMVIYILPIIRMSNRLL